jgi:hypothetical protein
LCQIRKLNNPPLLHQNLKIQTDQRIHPALHSPLNPLPHAQPPELSSIQRLRARPELSHERMLLQLDAADDTRNPLCLVAVDLQSVAQNTTCMSIGSAICPPGSVQGGFAGLRFWQWKRRYIPILAWVDGAAAKKRMVLWISRGGYLSHFFTWVEGTRAQMERDAELSSTECIF